MVVTEIGPKGTGIEQERRRKSELLAFSDLRNFPAKTWGPEWISAHEQCPQILASKEEERENRTGSIISIAKSFSALRWKE